MVITRSVGQYQFRPYVPIYISHSCFNRAMREKWVQPTYIKSDSKEFSNFEGRSHKVQLPTCGKFAEPNGRRSWKFFKDDVGVWKGFQHFLEFLTLKLSKSRISPKFLKENFKRNDSFVCKINKFQSQKNMYRTRTSCVEFKLIIAMSMRKNERITLKIKTQED